MTLWQAPPLFTPFEVMINIQVSMFCTHTVKYGREAHNAGGSRRRSPSQGATRQNHHQQQKTKDTWGGSSRLTDDRQ